jgi:hypothetical protein
VHRSANDTELIPLKGPVVTLSDTLSYLTNNSGTWVLRCQRCNLMAEHVNGQSRLNAVFSMTPQIYLPQTSYPLYIGNETTYAPFLIDVARFQVESYADVLAAAGF